MYAQKDMAINYIKLTVYFPIWKQGKVYWALFDCLSVLDKFVLVAGQTDIGIP